MESQVDGTALQVDPVPPPACAFALADVVDARPAGDAVGALGARTFKLEHPEVAIEKALRASGFRPDGELATHVVKIRLLRLYMQQEMLTMRPVAVYEARVDDGEPFLVRANHVAQNWNNGEGEGRAALGRALARANAELVRKLDGYCAANPGTAATPPAESHR